MPKEESPPPPLLRTKRTIDRFYKEVGKAIAEARGGRSQSVLAKALGLSRPSITNIENGKQRITLHHLWAAAEVLGVDVSELLPSAELLDRGEPTLVKEAARSKQPQVRKALKELSKEFAHDE